MFYICIYYLTFSLLRGLYLDQCWRRKHFGLSFTLVVNFKWHMSKPPELWVSVFCQEQEMVWNVAWYSENRVPSLKVRKRGLYFLLFAVFGKWPSFPALGFRICKVGLNLLKGEALGNLVSFESQIGEYVNMICSILICKCKLELLRELQEDSDFFRDFFLCVWC